MRNYLIIIGFLFFAVPARGQTAAPDIELILENLYERILNTKDDPEKLRINDSIRIIISAYATSDSVFIHTFTNLRYLGQINSPDSRLKILTWNLFLRNSPNRYFCYLVRKGEKGIANRVYILTGQNREEAIRTDITYSADDWYGALYYAIQPFRKERKVYYILLGYDYGNILISRKIIDVLYFTPGGELVLGKDCFIREEEVKFREVLEYSPEGIVTLRLNTRKLIVFDRLETITTGHGDGMEQYGAAGLTLDGYKFKSGMWRFISEVDIRNVK